MAVAIEPTGSFGASVGRDGSAAVTTSLSARGGGRTETTGSFGIGIERGRGGVRPGGWVETLAEPTGSFGAAGEPGGSFEATGGWGGCEGGRRLGWLPVEGYLGGRQAWWAGALGGSAALVGRRVSGRWVGGLGGLAALVGRCA